MQSAGSLDAPKQALNDLSCLFCVEGQRSLREARDKTSHGNSTTIAVDLANFLSVVHDAPRATSVAVVRYVIVSVLVRRNPER